MRFLEVGRLDVSAETQSGIGRLPFDLIRWPLRSHDLTNHTFDGRHLGRVESFL
jgi:hypothetical protein